MSAEGLNQPFRFDRRRSQADRQVFLMHVNPYAFFDDSGKWNDKDFICLCGYISDGDELQAFTIRWIKALKDCGLSHLHMKTFYSEMAKNEHTDKQAEELLNKLAIIARDHMQSGFAVGLAARGETRPGV